MKIIFEVTTYIKYLTSNINYTIQLLLLLCVNVPLLLMSIKILLLIHQKGYHFEWQKK